MTSDTVRVTPLSSGTSFAHTNASGQDVEYAFNDLDSRFSEPCFEMSAQASDCIVPDEYFGHDAAVLRFSRDDIKALLPHLLKFVGDDHEK